MLILIFAALVKYPNMPRLLMSEHMSKGSMFLKNFRVVSMREYNGVI